MTAEYPSEIPSFVQPIRRQSNAVPPTEVDQIVKLQEEVTAIATDLVGHAWLDESGDTSTGTLRFELENVNVPVIESRVDGETEDRFVVAANGNMLWTDGENGPDASLERSLNGGGLTVTGTLRFEPDNADPAIVVDQSDVPNGPVLLLPYQFAPYGLGDEAFRLENPGGGIVYLTFFKGSGRESEIRAEYEDPGYLFINGPRINLYLSDPAYPAADVSVGIYGNGLELVSSEGVTVTGDTTIDGELKALTPITSDNGTTRNLALADAGELITFTSGSAVTVNLPASGTVNFPVGTTICLARMGTGTVTVDPAVGVTLNGGTANVAMGAQYTKWQLVQLATNTWLFAP